MFRLILSLVLSLVPLTVLAFDSSLPDLTHSLTGYAVLALFVIAYVLVIFEEQIHLRKSKPVLAVAGLIWVLIAVEYLRRGEGALVEAGIRHIFLEYAELFFFLLVAMTYINALLERGVFAELRSYLISRGFTYRKLFWITGIIGFVLSSVCNNLTTAMIMCAVVLAVGHQASKFVALSCINIVVAVNAGGTFSPFGDITTLMLWQKGMVQFWEFFQLYVPALVNFVVPACIMSFFVPQGMPAVADTESHPIKHGGYVIVALFFLTIATAVVFHNFLAIPPVFGMMFGLAYLKLFGYYMRLRSVVWNSATESPPGSMADPYNFDVFAKIARSEWDTLFFFYGVIMSVGGLGFLGYLGLMSQTIYGELGPTTANVLIGIISAFIDNIPVMFAVLSMNPAMDTSQWLLVTLTAGVGGSLLSVGSAAGVALMGQARGYYTFFSHLKWMPVVALGYAASIAAHLLLNG